MLPQDRSVWEGHRHSSPLGLRRGRIRGSELSRRILQGGPRADSETKERFVRAEGNGRAGGLNELDRQLRSLSSSDNLMSAGNQASKGNVGKLPREENRVDWPVFGDGFVLYIVGLILVTIINDVLFKLFLGPPVPRVPQSQKAEVFLQTPSELGSQRERYMLRSYGNDPKYFQNISPPFTDGPLS